MSSEKTISGVAYTEPENLVRDFASRGLVVLPPESLGVAPDIHARIYAKEKELFAGGERVTTSQIPEMLESEFIAQVMSAGADAAHCLQRFLSHLK